MKQFILNNPTLVAVMITIALVVIIAWNDPYEKKKIATRKPGIAPIYRDLVSITEYIQTALTRRILEDIKVDIRRFAILYESHEDFTDSMDIIMDAFNEKRAHFEDAENLILITPTYFTHEKRN